MEDARVRGDDEEAADAGQHPALVYKACRCRLISRRQGDSPTWVHRKKKREHY